MLGDTTNTQIWTFSPSDGWNQIETTSKALSTSARGVIIAGSDGSKVSETYDARSISPNEVSQIVLLGADGKTVAAR